MHCKTCLNAAAPGMDACFDCQLSRAGLNHKVGASTFGIVPPGAIVTDTRDRQGDRSLSELYPKYYKRIPRNMDSIDVYGVHQLFAIDDPSGAIQHASKKLLLSGVRTGGKSKFKDIKEARDALNRWMQLNPETEKAAA